MLPLAIGTVCTPVRKSDYAGRCNQTHLTRAQRSFIDTLPGDKALGKFEVQKMGLKPKTGAFVFGLRNRRASGSFGTRPPWRWKW